MSTSIAKPKKKVKRNVPKQKKAAKEKRLAAIKAMEEDKKLKAARKAAVKKTIKKTLKKANALRKKADQLGLSSISRFKW